MLLVAYIAIMGSALTLSASGLFVPALVLGIVGSMLAYRWTIVAAAHRVKTQASRSRS